MNNVKLDLATKLWLVLYKAERALERRALGSIESLGITGTDFAILEVLLHKGPLPINTIGRKILLTSGSITTAVDRLEARGLVSRSFDAADRRIRIVALTKDGVRAASTSFKEHQRHLHQSMEVLSEREQIQLIALLKKLGKGVESNEEE